MLFIAYRGESYINVSLKFVQILLFASLIFFEDQLSYFLYDVIF